MWQWIVGLSLLAGLAQAATNSVTPPVRADGTQAVARGVAWLEAQQRENGSMGDEKYPAMTALALSALRAGGIDQSAGAEQGRGLSAAGY